MDRVKKIKVKKADGSFTDYIPIGVDATNVDLADGTNLEDKLKNMGTSDYADLINKPKINNVEISGNKAGSAFGLQSEVEYMKNITLSSESWQGDESAGYYYIVSATGVTEQHRANVYMDLVNQAKMVDGYTTTGTDEIKIYTSEKPTDNVVVNIEIVLIKDKTN